jgi:hypothetical protein
LPGPGHAIMAERGLVVRHARVAEADAARDLG